MISYLGAGVVLCGGGARIRGVDHLAEQVFDLPVTVGRATCISGQKAALDQPEFAAAIGLVKFASFQQKRKSNGGFWTLTLRETFGDLLGRR